MHAIQLLPLLAAVVAAAPRSYDVYPMTSRYSTASRPQPVPAPQCYSASTCGRQQPAQYARRGDGSFTVTHITISHQGRYQSAASRGRTATPAQPAPQQEEEEEAGDEEEGEEEEEDTEDANDQGVSASNQSRPSSTQTQVAVSRTTSSYSNYATSAPSGYSAYSASRPARSASPSNQGRPACSGNTCQARPARSASPSTQGRPACAGGSCQARAVTATRTAVTQTSSTSVSAASSSASRQGRSASPAGISASSRSRSPSPAPAQQQDEEEEQEQEEGEIDDQAADDVDATEDDADADGTEGQDSRPRDPTAVSDPTRRIPIAAPISAGRSPAISDVFFAGEEFALYNRHRGTCFSVRLTRFRKRVKLVAERCSLAQAFLPRSRLTFHWLPARDNNLARLAIYHKGQELCATSKLTGTFFQPCDSKSIKYSLGATTKKGQFKVRNAGRHNKCLDADFKTMLNERMCGPFRDQAWEKVHIGFEPAIKRGIEAV